MQVSIKLKLLDNWSCLRGMFSEDSQMSFWPWSMSSVIHRGINDSSEQLFSALPFPLYLSALKAGLGYHYYMKEFNNLTSYLAKALFIKELI